MKIGIAGAMSLALLDLDLPMGERLPVVYDHPPVSDLINSLLRHGFEVIGYTTSEDIAEPQIFRGPNLVICVAPRAPHAGRDLFRSERHGLVKLMQGFPCDIIHAQWTYEYGWAALDSQIPTLVTVRDHALTVLRFRRDPYGFMRFLMNFIVLRRAQYLSTNSEYLYSRLPAWARKKAAIIPNFFANRILEYRNPGVHRDDVIVSVCNGFGRLKNLQAGLQAFSLIRKEFPELRYQLVGDGMGPGGPAECYARSGGIADHVMFLGKMSHPSVAQCIANAQVLLHPSREESFGMSVLEGMVLGTPVVAGETSGNIPFLLEHGEAGILCDVTEPTVIAAQLRRLLTDVPLATRLSKRAFDVATKSYSEDSVIESYISCYERILTGSWHPHSDTK